MTKTETETQAAFRIQAEIAKIEADWNAGRLDDYPEMDVLALESQLLDVLLGPA
jgi:hypothetical protein